MPRVIQCSADGLYCDGGLLSANPSRHGLTWAYRYVCDSGKVVSMAGCGVLTCADLGLTTVENNLAETLAVLFGLEAMPDGWAGTLRTDNLNALRRALKPNSASFGGVPTAYVERLRDVRRRLGMFDTVLLGGHPTRADLARGCRKDGKPVSIYNVECDWRCGELASAWWTKTLSEQEGA